MTRNEIKTSAAKLADALYYVDAPGALQSSYCIRSMRNGNRMAGFFTTAAKRRRGGVQATRTQPARVVEWIDVYPISSQPVACSTLAEAEELASKYGRKIEFTD